LAKPNILVTVPTFPMEAVDVLSELADVRVNPHTGMYTKDELIKEIEDVDVLVLGNEKFDKEVARAAMRLRMIARFGVGYDNVDIVEATRNNLWVTYTPGASSKAVAELTIGLMLSLAKRIPQADHYVRSGKWSEGAVPFPIGSELNGKLLGIIGLGQIGLEVAERARCFGMATIYFDKVRNFAAEQRLGVTPVNVDELLRRVDFVAIHVALTEETKGMIGWREIGLMKNTAFLVNTSRGAVVDQEALYDALKEGRIAGAGLDVFSVEPIRRNDPLLSLDNVVLTPHIAAVTAETILNMASMVVEDVARFLRGGEPIHTLIRGKSRLV